MTDLPDQLPERILVIRCQAGDASAFEELVAAYAARLRYFLLKLLGKHDAAEDAMQDVWLDVHRALPRLRRPEAFCAWLYRIARDRAFRTLRRTRPEHPFVDAADVAVESDEEGFSAEDAERIHTALDTLSAEHREVLLLRFIEDLSYEEIAQVTGCGLGTVKSRIHYAKHLLRQEIERRGDHE
jgi:RNA polymerase sigma-70 factor (ECF subfamily)